MTPNKHSNNIKKKKKKKKKNASIHLLKPKLQQGLTFSWMQRGRQYLLLLFPETQES